MYLLTTYEAIFGKFSGHENNAQRFLSNGMSRGELRHHDLNNGFDSVSFDAAYLL